MNRCYVIVPGALLSAFVLFEQDFAHRRKEEERAQALATAAAQQAADAARAERERLAAEEARKRGEERERTERERADKKRRDHDALIASLRTHADQRTAEADTLSGELAELTTQLADLRSRRERSEHEVFELARRVELQRIDRRSAELETQRATTLLATRLAGSRWATPP